MSELDSAVKFLGQWPIVQGFFIIVISFLGVLTYRRGERDRKSMGSGTIEIPLYLLSGPVSDAMGALHDINAKTERTNQLLHQLVNEVRHQNQLLEWIGNQLGISRPRVD